MPKDLKKSLKESAFNLGIDVFGVADLNNFDFTNSPTAPNDLTSNFTRGVSVAMALPKGIFKKIKDKPTPEYAKYYTIVNEQLDLITLKLAKHIERYGYTALPIPASQKIVVEGLFGSAITHKAVARLAGVGWQGKSLLIISPEFGPRIRIATILTDAPLEADTPIEFQCGKCQKCKKACPSDAIKGVPPAESFYKNREEALYFDRCFNKLVNEFSNLPSVSQSICGFCIKACPYSGIK